MSDNHNVQNIPAVPAGDTLISAADGVYYSYGPRVVDRSEAGTTVVNGNTKHDVIPPAEGQEPEFYGVYLWGGEDSRWNWVVDLPSVEAVHEYVKAQ